MATIQIKTGDEYLAKLSRLSAGVKDKVCGKAIYAGADIVADTIRAEIEALPVDNRFLKGGGMLAGPGSVQKKGLLASLGVAPMQDDGTGFLNVKIGFDGYNAVKTKRWPKGQPNQMIARSVERGTSFMTANPFMKRAVAKARKRAVEAMKKAADQEIETMMKG